MKPSLPLLAVMFLLSGVAGDGFAGDRDHRHDRRAEWRSNGHRLHVHPVHLRHVEAWRYGRHEGYVGGWWIAAGARYFHSGRALPAPPQSYGYYCAFPAGYSPYVARCRVAWQAVPVP